MLFSDISRLPVIEEVENILEIRYENDAMGNPIYIGYTQIPNASEDYDGWYIVALEYDGSDFLVRRRMPDQGLGFKYMWSQRATYFS